MHEEILIIENLIAAILVIAVASIKWKIGNKIGFSTPWRLMAIGFIFVAIGRIFAFIDEVYLIVESLPATEIAIFSMLFIIIGFSFVIIGLKDVYDLVDGVGKK